MSEIKYGLISKVDASVIERTIDLICEEFPDGYLHTCEIGVYGGETGWGISYYIHQKGRRSFSTGIDSLKDSEPIQATPDRLIIGNSNEVYNRLEDESQHMIFVDGCHCFSHIISDFFCYAPKVKKGGYMSFHDTGKHIKPFKDFQHGDEKNPDAYISVRKALKAIGLIEYQYEFTFGEMYPEKYPGWQLIFDEADETNEAGGVCIFKKLC